MSVLTFTELSKFVGRGLLETVTISKEILSNHKKINLRSDMHVTRLIVSITNFSIVVCSLCAYLSRDRRAITWVFNYRYPI